MDAALSALDATAPQPERWVGWVAIYGPCFKPVMGQERATRAAAHRSALVRSWAAWNVAECRWPFDRREWAALVRVHLSAVTRGEWVK